LGSQIYLEINFALPQNDISSISFPGRAFRQRRLSAFLFSLLRAAGESHP
jgi:hypothetical protein